MRKLDNDEFIDRAMCILGDGYDFTKTRYFRSNMKVIITCKEHGDFLVTPNNVLNRFSGCPLCKGGKVSQAKRDTRQAFIKKARKIHGDRYNYSLVEYVTSKIKIKIVCPRHGIFEQTPNNHLKGCGCRKCGFEFRTKPERDPVSQDSRLAGEDPGTDCSPQSS